MSPTDPEDKVVLAPFAGLANIDETEFDQSADEEGETTTPLGGGWDFLSKLS